MAHHVVKTVPLDALGHLHQQEDQAVTDNARADVVHHVADAAEPALDVVANALVVALEIAMVHVISIVKIVAV